MSLPTLLGVEARSASGLTHPALVDPAGDGWQGWAPPADGWTPLANVAQTTDADGVVRISASAGEDVSHIRATFERSQDERFWGFGERSNATEHSGSLVEHWVGEGPYQLSEYPLIEAITPRWAIRRRTDATYYPIPWLLSSLGYGALTEGTTWSCHDLRDTTTWSVIALSSKLQIRLFPGPTPADALARFTDLTGRQPTPASSWFFGPWIQTGHANLVPLDEEIAILDALQRAAAPIVAVETHMRRLPGGAHTDHRETERARAAEFHRRDLASLTYLSPTISRDFTTAFDKAVRTNALERDEAGDPITFAAYIGGRQPPVSEQALLDFNTEAAADLYRGLIGEVFEDGHDGWMEDFGEYSPKLEGHNGYPLRYHRVASEVAATLGRSPARFVRSGWTGSARYSPLVWGGDPTTGWGFDGLRSAVVEGLSMGLSGVAFWGSDIGGFFSLGYERLTPELLIRWIQFGAMCPLMRTKAGGVSIGGAKRPQVWDSEIVPHWRRWASFHLHLVPYLMKAAGEYARTGMPLMRHHALTDPDDTVLTRLEDQYMLGPDLLVAPVLEPGVTERTVRLPAGEWIDLWRSMDMTEDGSLKPRQSRVLAGGEFHVVPAPLLEIPVLVRSGAEILRLR